MKIVKLWSAIFATFGTTFLYAATSGSSNNENYASAILNFDPIIVTGNKVPSESYAAPVKGGIQNVLGHQVDVTKTVPEPANWMDTVDRLNSLAAAFVEQTQPPAKKTRRLFWNRTRSNRLPPRLLWKDWNYTAVLEDH